MVGSTIRFLIAYSIAGRWEGLGMKLELKYFPDGQSVMNNVAIELEILQATLILCVAICACVLGHTHTHTSLISSQLLDLHSHGVNWVFSMAVR